MRRRISVLIVVIFALFAGACTEGGAGSPIGPSPTVPSNTVDPSKGDYQTQSVSSSPTTNAVIRDGDSWSVEETFWCKPGLVHGIIFIREDGTMKQDSLTLTCSRDVFSGTRFTGIAGPANSLAVFAKGHTVTVEFATAENRALWDAGQLLIRPGLHVLWRFE